MAKFHSVALAVVLSIAGLWAQVETPISVSGDGWTVTADGEKGVLTFARDNLGVVMKDVQLNLPGAHGLRLLKRWTATKAGLKQLFIRTSEPPTG